MPTHTSPSKSATKQLVALVVNSLLLALNSLQRSSLGSSSSPSLKATTPEPALPTINHLMPLKSTSTSNKAVSPQLLLKVWKFPSLLSIAIGCPSKAEWLLIHRFPCSSKSNPIIRVRFSSPLAFSKGEFLKLYIFTSFPSSVIFISAKPEKKEPPYTVPSVGCTATVNRSNKSSSGLDLSSPSKPEVVERLKVVHCPSFKRKNPWSRNNWLKVWFSAPAAIHNSSSATIICQFFSDQGELILIKLQLGSAIFSTIR